MMSKRRVCGATGIASSVVGFPFACGGKNEVLTGAGRPDTFVAKIGAGGALDAWARAFPAP